MYMFVSSVTSMPQYFDDIVHFQLNLIVSCK